MKLKDTMLQTYNDFTLDVDKIGSRSTSKNNVELPYNGPLPENIADAETARIRFNVQPARIPRATLIISHSIGKDTRHPLEVTAEEIKTILGGLFDDATIDKSGLSPYWFGVWQINYFGWRETQNVYNLLNIIGNLPDEKRYALLTILQPATA